MTRPITYPAVAAPSKSISLPHGLEWVVKLSRQLLIGFCLIQAFGLRLLNLGGFNFWYDEVEAIRYSLDFSAHDVHPPTFYYLLSLVLRLGKSEFILRFLPVIFGVLSVALVYVIAKRLFSSRVALLSTFLASISPALIWHSQDVRMYNQLVFACLLAAYAYIRVLNSNARRDWAFYIVACVLAFYSHLYGALMVGSLSLHFLLTHRRFWKPWLISTIIIGLSYIPWLIILAGLQAKQIGTGRPLGFLGLPYTFFVFSTGYSVGPAINELRTPDLKVLIPYLPLIGFLVVVVFILLLAGFYRLRQLGREKLLLMALWAFLPCIIAVVVPYFRASMTFNVRYVLFAAPGFLIILALGIDTLRRYYAIGFLLLGCLVVYNAKAIYNNINDPAYSKEDVRSAAHYIEQRAQPGDAIVTITVGRVFEWYSTGNNPIISNIPQRQPSAILKEIDVDSPVIWLVESRPWQTDEHGELKALLNRQYTLGETAQFPGVTVYQYCKAACT
jgi:4-amino-4-deoxy-L-arabinose transferase-like glycosyltransferase